MKIQINTDLISLKEQLKKLSKDVSLAEVLDWDPTTWAHLCAIAAGLNPFSAPAVNMIPAVLRAFLPRLDFKPAPEDRKHAFFALKRAIIHVNKAIVETTKSTYDQLLASSIPNLQQIIQTQFPGGLSEFLSQLENELLDYEKRKMFLEAGASMMDAEQAWLSKHHTLAVAIVGYVAAQPKKSLTNDEFLGVITDVGILNNGNITYSPVIANSVTDAAEVDDPISKALQDAEQSVAKSKQKLLDSLKPKKKK